jgi:hypothetical protein
LDERRILGSAREGLDLQILLDPFAEELDLPTAAVRFGDFRGRRVQGIG